MRLGTKLALEFTVVIIIVSAAAAALSIHRENTTLKEELEKQGLILTETLAAESREAFITDKFVPVMNYIDMLSENEYVVYVMVRDRGGRVMAHSDLSKVGKLITDPALEVIYTEKPYIGTSGSSEGESIHDIAVPVTVMGEAVGVAQIGYSLRSLEVSTTKARNQIILAMGGNIAVGILFALLFARLLTKPITKLRDATIEIGKGNLDARIEVETNDEIGDLAASFKKMTGDLKKKTVSKDYVDNIFKSMIDTLVVVTPDAKIQTVNQAACDLLGYKPEELVGKPVSIIFAKEEESPFKESKFELSRRVEKTYLSKDGREISVLFSGSVMRDSDDKILGIVCVAVDITERKQAEEELQNRIDELERFHRLVVGRELRMIELKEHIKELERVGRQTKK